VKQTFWLLISLSAFLLPALLSGQPATLDSLEQLLKNDLSQAERFTINLQLAKQYLKINPEPGFAFAEAAMATAEATQDKEQLALAQICLADYECMNGGFEPAKGMVHEALSLAPSPSDKVRLEAYNLLGNIFFYQSQADSARYYYTQMESIVSSMEAPSLDYRKKATAALFNLGSTFRQLGQPDSAILNYNQALEAAKRIDFKEILPYILENLANMQINQEEGISYLLEAIAIDEALGNNNHLAGLYENLGTIYGNMGDTLQEGRYREQSWQLVRTHQFVNRELAIGLSDYGVYLIEVSRLETAREVLDYALDMGKKMQDPSSTSYALSILGLLSLRQGAEEQGLSYLSEAEAQARAGADPGYFIYSLTNIADGCIQLGQPQRAIGLLLESQRTADQIGLPHLRGDAAKLLSKAYQELGDHANALVAYQESTAIADSLSKAENRAAIQEIRTRYETEKTEAENEFLKLENQQTIKQRNRILAAVAILLFLLSVLGILYRKVLQGRRQIAAQNLKLAELNQTKDQLFAIIAHDLRGEASAFQQLAQIVGFHLKNRNLDRLEQVFGQVNKSAANLNTLLDNLLQWALTQLEGVRLKPTPLHLQQEAAHTLQLFESHAELKDIQLINEVPASLNAFADQNSIQLILRNLISNAIKFTPTSGSIRVSGKQDGQQVVLSVEDTGQGMSASQIAAVMEGRSAESREGTSGERGTGLGLSLCNAFAVRNQGTFHIEAQSGGGTLCSIRLPIAQ
jgi:signal transduction histidine kinase